MRKGLKIKYIRRREKEEVGKETDTCRIAFFLLSDSTVSEFYVPTFRNTLFYRIISSTNFNAQFSLFIYNMFVTLLFSTCFVH